MARPLRLEYAGAIYHVSCRMIGQHRGALPQLFRDDADRLRLLDRLADRVDQYKIRLYLFTLMANHFHLVFETPEANCSKFMRNSPRSIGSDAFRLWVDERYREQLRGHGAPEDVSFLHIVEPLAEDLVLEAVASGLGVEVLELSRRRRSSANRAIAARMLLNYAGLTQRQSADLLGMNTGAAVSVQLRSLPGVLSRNRKLARSVKAIEAELTSLQRNGRGDS